MLTSKTLMLRVGLTTLAATIGLAQNRVMPAQEPQIERARLDRVTNWAAPLYWQASGAQGEARTTRAEAVSTQNTGAASRLGVTAVFVAITPCRLMDTRVGQGFGGAFGPPSMAANTARTLPVPSSSCGLPPGAAAYSVNITVVPASGVAVGFVTAWPDDQTQPTTAVLTDTIPGAIVGNAAIVPAGADGGIRLFTQNATDLVIDVNGYFALPDSLPFLGSAAAPALTFGDTTTGLFSSGAGSVSIATNGVNALTVGPTGDLDLRGSITKGGTLFVHNFGSLSTGIGLGALASNSGANNTAVGTRALSSNAGGSGNTAVGTSALSAAATAPNNTAVGAWALQHEAIGVSNTAVGAYALQQHTSNNNNTALGYHALSVNNDGDSNTALGSGALGLGATGSYSTAIGVSALVDSVGSHNTAVGMDALVGVGTGNYNTALGDQAGSYLTGGDRNIFIATFGPQSPGPESNTIRIGDTNQNRAFIAGIRGVTTGQANAIPVVIDSNGQLGTVSSSRKVKSDIRDMRDTTDTIMSLHPVEFRYTAHGPEGPVQYGLIAEEVAEVAPELVVRKPDGEFETVFYDKVNAMLLKQVQMQQRTIDAQAAALRRMEERLAAMEGVR